MSTKDLQWPVGWDHSEHLEIAIEALKDSRTASISCLPYFMHKVLEEPYIPCVGLKCNNCMLNLINHKP